MAVPPPVEGVVPPVAAGAWEDEDDEVGSLQLDDDEVSAQAELDEDDQAAEELEGWA